MRRAVAALALMLAGVAQAAGFRDRLPEDEVIYFLLPDRFENGDPSNDRGGLSGGRMRTGFDPTAKGFFLGGDLKGLTARLDYIQGLGATAVWLAPVFRNKPVQGGPGQESAGYHGYWVTDFTRVDPHFGTDAEFDAFVAAAHARGMKVYMDIIANHTADVIQYRECVGKPCPYRSRADFPYQRRGGIGGAAINPGFAGDGVRTAGNFAKLTDMRFAYTPFVPAAEAGVKVPAWLNDVALYHNRGNTTFTNESSTMGDFVGLDDLATEDPRVVRGMIDIYGAWVDRGVDGFRIDTAKHVNPEFWAEFVPAILERARARGVPNFHIFGEVATGDMDTALLARHTRVDGLPSVLDFAFARAMADVVGGDAPTEQLERLFAGDANYEGGEAAALRLPTFLGNHDAGRFAWFVRRARPGASDDEVTRRVILAHAMMFTLRGVPTVYSGDEQGFVGDGGDQDAREPLFASQVPSYNDNRLLGTARTNAVANFERGHPIYRAIAELARARSAEPALRRGEQLLRAREPKPGLFAVSRMLDGREVLVAFNTSNEPLAANVEVGVGATRFRALLGACPAAAQAPGSVRVRLPALGYAVCAAE